MCEQFFGLFETGMDLTNVQVELDILGHRFRISTKSGGIFLTIAIICIPSDSTILLLLSRDLFFHWPTFHACRVLQINLNLYKAQLIQLLCRFWRFSVSFILARQLMSFFLHHCNLTAFSKSLHCINWYIKLAIWEVLVGWPLNFF